MWECSLLDNTLHLGFGIRRSHCQLFNAVAKTLRFKRLIPFICFISSHPAPPKQNFPHQHVAPAEPAGFFFFSFFLFILFFSSFTHFFFPILKKPEKKKKKKMSEES